jgi:predicted cupin superfamily sugar epimerase
VTADPREIIRLLGMKPHPEGGHYCETWRMSAAKGERPAGTAIYYLLMEGENSHWHRVDADEIWHWYGGAALSLMLSESGTEHEARVLGPDLAAGERPQIIVPKGWWQAARSQGAWTLAGCTVSPGFRFEGFELAPPGWAPG